MSVSRKGSKHVAFLIMPMIEVKHLPVRMAPRKYSPLTKEIADMIDDLTLAQKSKCWKE